MGHYKRVCSILNSSPEFRKYDINIYGSYKKFSTFLKRTEFFNNFFEIESNEDDYENDLIDLYGKKPFECDFIWSDNLVFPVKYQKTILSGSFLWADQDSYKTRDADFKTLKSKQTTMIGNMYFSKPNLKSLTEFIEVGMYDYEGSYLDKYNEAKGILISIGTSLDAINYFKEFIPIIKEIIEYAQAGDSCIYLEPWICEIIDAKIKNVRIADFSKEMFKQIGAAIIRPGIGTLSSVWATKGRIYPCFEPNNDEMEFNASIINQIQKTNIKNDLVSSFQKSLNYINNSSEVSSHLNNLSSVDYNGIKDSADWILNFFEE